MAILPVDFCCRKWIVNVDFDDLIKRVPRIESMSNDVTMNMLQSILMMSMQELLLRPMSVLLH